MSSVVVWALSILAAALFWQWWKTPCNNFPPGPRGFPILGALPFLGDFPAKTIKKWSDEEYGPVVSVRMGIKDSVYLNTYEAFYKAYVEDGLLFAGRPKIELFHQIFGSNGINTNDYSDFLMFQKELVVDAVKRFGSAHDGLPVKQQGEYMVGILQDKVGKPFNLRMDMFKFTCNLTTNIFFGKGFAYDDPTLEKLLASPLENLYGGPEESKKLLLFGLFYRYLYYVPPFYGINQEFMKRQNILLDTMQLFLDEHRQKFKNRQKFDKKNIKDLIDLLLYEQKYGEWKDDARFTDQQIKVLAEGLYTGIAMPVSSTMLWNILALLHFPKYQTMIIKEIDSVIGNDQPSIEHKKDMPITSAFLEEVWRNNPAVPITPAHMTRQDVSFMGYQIPNNTEVSGNIWGANHDPKVWPDPEKFDPGRHLDEQGKFVPSKKIIPFSIGVRSCDGKSFARMEVFLLFTNILQKFSVKPGQDSLPPLNGGASSVIYSPLPYKIILEKR